MKRILFFVMGLISLLTPQSQLSAKVEFINITALHCNPEAIRNKTLLEQCVDAIAAEYSWSAASYASPVHTESGFLIPLHAGQRTMTLQCINKSNAVHISIIKLKGNVTVAELKKIIKSYLETANVQIKISA